MSVRDEILARADELNETPLAVQALWDGDTSGWYLCLSAVLTTQIFHLGCLQEGGDIRIFNGQVPPWPEAQLAIELGKQIADRYGVELYFPSPNHPEDDCPSWNEREQGYPCGRCGILLLQQIECPWRGICYHCHLDERTEAREASWTPEERAGPRCHICGTPAKKQLGNGQVCQECFAKYEVHRCVQCGVQVLISKSIVHKELCRHCELRNAIAALTQSQRTKILEAERSGRLKAIQVTKEFMDCELGDVELILHYLKNPD